MSWGNAFSHCLLKSSREAWTEPVRKTVWLAAGHDLSFLSHTPSLPAGLSCLHRDTGVADTEAASTQVPSINSRLQGPSVPHFLSVSWPWDMKPNPNSDNLPQGQKWCATNTLSGKGHLLSLFLRTSRDLIK